MKLIKIEYGMVGSLRTAYINPAYITSIQIDPSDETNCDVNILGSDTSKHCYKNVTVNNALLEMMK